MSLIRIKGIGDKVAKSITELTGIDTLEDFAVIDEDVIQKIADKVPGSPAKVTDWVEQAKGLLDETDKEIAITPEDEIPKGEKETTSEDDSKDNDPVVKDDIKDNKDDVILNSGADITPEVDVDNKLGLDEWFNGRGLEMLELGFARSSVLVEAANYYGVNKRNVLRHINLGISTKDNLLKAFKNV